MRTNIEIDDRLIPEAIKLSGLSTKRAANEPLLVGDLILCEILQGARSERQARMLEKELQKFDVVPMLNPAMATAAAKNYRLLRSEGITIRKIIDLLIGTFCIARGHTLLHDDRDFIPMETHLGLKSS